MIKQVFVVSCDLCGFYEKAEESSNPIRTGVVCKPPRRWTHPIGNPDVNICPRCAGKLHNTPGLTFVIEKGRGKQ